MELYEPEVKPRFDTDRAYLADLADALGKSSRQHTIELPMTTGEVFHADGKVTRILRGDIEAAFIPKRGTVNLTEIEPPVPMRAPLRTVRMPKGFGAVLVLDVYAQVLQSEQFQSAVEKYLQWGEELTLAMRLRMAAQDTDFADDTLAAIQIQPQAMAERLRARCMTKTRTARKASRGTTRIRAYSRT